MRQRRIISPVKSPAEIPTEHEPAISLWWVEAKQRVALRVVPRVLQHEPADSFSVASVTFSV